MLLFTTLKIVNIPKVFCYTSFPDRRVVIGFVGVVALCLREAVKFGGLAAVLLYIKIEKGFPCGSVF